MTKTPGKTFAVLAGFCHSEPWPDGHQRFFKTTSSAWAYAETLREKDWGAAADEIDEFGEYDCTAIDDWRIDEMIKSAVAFIRSQPGHPT